MNQRESLQDWQKFLLAESHVLQRNPALLFQQAANQPDSTLPALAARTRLEAGLEARPWLQYVNKPQSRSACLMTLKINASFVGAYAFSADGRYIVSGSFDKTLKLWDASTGDKLATLAGHRGSVHACAFSADGRRIVSASDDKTLKLWDAQTGAELAALEGHMLEVRAFAFSPDGRHIVSASDDLALKLWDAWTGAELATLAGHTMEVCACAFSPDGRRIVSGCDDGTLKIWDSQTGAELFSLEGHTSPVRWCAFSYDSRIIVSTSMDKTLKLWDAQMGMQIGEYELGGNSLRMAWNPGGDDLAAFDCSGCLLILRLRNFLFGPPLATAWESSPYRALSPQRGKQSPHFGCPQCRVWSAVPASALGTVIPCPHCRGSVKLNSFTIDADWRPIAEAWKPAGE